MKNGNKRQRYIKGLIHKQYVKNGSNFAQKNIAFQRIKQILTELKEEINSSTIMFGDFKTPLTMERYYRQRLNKKTTGLYLSGLLHYT